MVRSPFSYLTAVGWDERRWGLWEADQAGSFVGGLGLAGRRAVEQGQGGEAGLAALEVFVGGQVFAPGGLGSQPVAALVVGVAGVTFDPAEVDFAGGAERQQALPKVDVLGFFGFGAHPAARLPASGPAFGDAIDDVAGIAEQDGVGGALKGVQTDDAG